ncbi:hypothetical protein [Clostridium botulinum]|uniref:hypothetical protein n=1 Tax=Clostridium botulinum TaxID=1491 RepID=UPI003DA246ED
MPTGNKPIRKEYSKLQVYTSPIFEIPKKLDYKVLLNEYFQSHNKKLTPVKTNKDKTIIPKDSSPREVDC